MGAKATELIDLVRTVLLAVSAENSKTGKIVAPSEGLAPFSARIDHLYRPHSYLGERVRRS